jgi:hypothetical protein
MLALLRLQLLRTYARCLLRKHLLPLLLRHEHITRRSATPAMTCV